MKAAAEVPISFVTALVGDDDFGRRQALDALRERLFAGEEGDEVALDGSAGDPVELGRRVSEELRTRPLTGGPKLVVVMQAEELVKKAKDLILGLMDAPPGFSRLVVAARNFGAGRNKLRDRLKQDGAYHEFRRPADSIAPWEHRRRADDTDLVRWVNDRARGHGLRLAAGVAAALTARIGSNLSELDGILARWEMMHEAGGTVGIEAVEALGPRHRQVDSFALVDTVLTRDAGATLEMLTCLLSEGMVIGGKRLLNPRDMLAPVIGAFFRRFRTTARARRYLAAGGAPRGLTEEIGVRSFLVERTVEEARRFGEAELRFAIRRLLQADQDFKLGRRAAREVLTDLVLDLIRGGPTPSPIKL